ncbi:unnamed protein product [Peronospora destructor]|uniref:DNA2/NAM7 helicase-like C-terminal domain-containing protein n=1 Tax=Peronospora destructor TaxID=86335 RepID=A0AAV0VD11_9STRA|nr:unnamed protein product [Peronospora destructor]
MSNNGRRRMENVVEAQVIAGLVELLVLGSVPAYENVIISPFRSQVALIRQHLTAAGLHSAALVNPTDSLDRRETCGRIAYRLAPHQRCAVTRAKQKAVFGGVRIGLSKLPRDAVETLRQLAVSVAAPVEPDPEQGAMSGSRVRQTTENVKISILQRSASSSNGDIEALVSDVSDIPLRPHQRARSPQLKPISRDIFGEM